MFDLSLLVPLCSVLALGRAFCLVLKIFKYDEGTGTMKEIAGFVREGTQAYLKRQYRASGIFL